MKMNHQRIVASTLVLFLGLAVMDFGAQPGYTQSIKDPGKVKQGTTKTLDPCKFAEAAKLKAMLTAGISPYFPMKAGNGGEHVTISNPEITNATCAPFKITIKANLRYWKTTNGVQLFSTSGDVRFTSPVEARVTHIVVPAGTPLQAADIINAKGCMTNIVVTGLNLNNVPNWLDDGWVKDLLNQKLANQACFDITNLVKYYVQQGGSL